MRPYRIVQLALLGLLLTGHFVPDASAQQKMMAQDPVGIIRQMCDYLKSLKQFSFRTEITADQGYPEGRKIQYGLDTVTYVKRPDKLRVKASGDLVDKSFFFNGKTIILYDQSQKVYASMDVPPDIEDALNLAQKDFGLTVSLTDLASPMLWEHISKGLERPLYVGLHKVRGVPCHHLAFDKGDIEFQVWIDAGAKPLPRKILITMDRLGGAPQWTGYLSDWKTSVAIKDGLFQFIAPPGVQKINFVPVQKAETPMK